uniref:Uncharacterized protein n=1 Tax=viral metagenome TaxID=1070528 RepID=A0A2V0RB31_9ZZZZ
MKFNINEEQDDDTAFEEVLNDVIEAAEDVIDNDPEETARDRLADKGLDYIYKGVKNIKDCINNPLESRLEDVGISALRYVVSSYHARDSGLEQSLRDKSDERILASQHQDSLMNKLSTEQTELISSRAQLHGLEGALRDISNGPDDDITKMPKLRSLMSEIETYKSMIQASEEQVAKYMVSLPRAQADYDAVLRDVDELLEMKSRVLYGPEVMLLCAPNYVIDTDDDLPYITARISDEIENGIVPELKEQLNKIKLSKNDNGAMELALFSATSSLTQPLKTHGEEGNLLNGPLISSYNFFKNSEVGKVIHNINVNSLFMQEFRGEKFKFDPARQNEIIMNDPIKSLDTTLMNEMYFLNLTCMSGYDPITWARCFGVPISGVGKQILKGWRNGGKIPLNADKLRKIFLEGDVSKEHNLLLDVNKLDYAESFKDKMSEKILALKNTDLLTEQVKNKLEFEKTFDKLKKSSGEVQFV